MQKTTVITKEKIDRKWYLLDATGVRLGRLATLIASMLKGKKDAIYSPNLDCGNYVIVINTRNVDVHPSRFDRKIYRSHSQYPGGLKEIKLRDLIKKNPNELVRKAVKGMLPRNKIGRKMINRLFLYQKEEHEYNAQKPKLVKIK